ncbi:MAG TPA: glycosyltransferase [Chloroflexota bacterium]|nr:glycosyltransferase [Chloroflexota bacterium]
MVKNEEANLPRCLGSLQHVVDEIVLVDTGSTDRTIEIAESFGAKVFHFEWCDDFSAARNESLRHASGEWIIWVDGDDELVETRPGALKALCQDKQAPDWGYWVEVRSPYGATGELEVSVRHWRLFRNERGIWFRGRVHEEPWPPRQLEPRDIVSQDRVHVMHWGYIPSGNLMQLKSERNRRLLEKSIEEEPTKPLHYYNLGRQLSREGDPAAAFEIFRQGLDLWEAQGGPNWSFAHSLFAFAAQSAVDSNHFQEALEIEAKTPANLVSAELLCQAGTALWRLERRHEAVARLERAHTDPSVIHPHLHDVGRSTWHPLLMLSGLYDQLGDAARGYDCAKRAADYAPEHPEILLACGYLAARLSRWEESLAWLRKLLSGHRDDGFKAQGRAVLLQVGQQMGQPEIELEALEGEAASVSGEQRCLMRAAAYAKLGDQQAQFEELQAGCIAYPESYDIRYRLADVLAENGYETEAISVLAAALDDAEAPAESYRRLTLLLAKAGRMEDATNAAALYARLVEGAQEPAAAGA